MEIGGMKPFYVARFPKVFQRLTKNMPKSRPGEECIIFAGPELVR
jgi:hypothetical protein